MRRDFIVIVGGQGCGKSVWAKAMFRDSKRLIVFDPMRSYPLNYDWDDGDGNSILSGKARHFRIGTDTPDEIALLFDLAYAAGDCTLIVEECGVLFTKRQVLSDSIRRVVFMGRHRRVNLVLIAQRAVSIPVDLRSQANRFICFRQIEEQDVNAACAVIGKKYKPIVPALPELRCVDWHNGMVKTYGLTHKNSRDSVESQNVGTKTADDEQTNIEDDESA